MRKQYKAHGVVSWRVSSACCFSVILLTGDMLAGTLEKRIGEKSGRQSLPEAWKWQKRYFVLSEPQGKLVLFQVCGRPAQLQGAD